MIYLVDEPLSDFSHSSRMLSVILEYGDEVAQLIPITSKMSDIKRQLISLTMMVNPCDVVVCPWSIDYDESVNRIVSDLAQNCFVVTAAGNTNQPIELFTPASAKGVIVVGSLNKSGIKASMSNYSETSELVWVTGTNVPVNGTLESGTSVSCCLYAGLLNKAIINGNIDYVNTYIYEIIMQLAINSA